MQVFGNILFLYQGRIGDEEALDRATALARDNGAALTLGTTVAPPAGPVLALLSPPPSDRYAALVEERRRQLQRIAAGIPPSNSPIRSLALAGRADEEVLQAIRRHRFDLVMMTADYDSLLSAAAFGSLARTLMRKAPCPVWLCRPGATRTRGRVLAAVDPDYADSRSSPLDLRVLELAAALARQGSGKLDILHAWELEGHELETSRSEITDEIRERLLSGGSSRCAQTVSRLCLKTKLAGLDTAFHFPRGAAAAEIARFAKDRPVDVIVMGIARSGLAASLFGNVAEDVLLQVSTPVLTVRKPGAVRAAEGLDLPPPRREAAAGSREVSSRP